MPRMRSRTSGARLLAHAAGALTVLAATLTVTTATATATASAAPGDGVEVFEAPLEIPQETPTLTDGLLLEKAEARVEANPDQLAPPYLDPATGRVVIPIITAAATTTATAGL